MVFPSVIGVLLVLRASLLPRVFSPKALADAGHGALLKHRLSQIHEKPTLDPSHQHALNRHDPCACFA